jgi:hypothetical protein
MSKMNDLTEEIKAQIDKAFDLLNEISDTFTDIMKEFEKDNQPEEHRDLFTHTVHYHKVGGDSQIIHIIADSFDDAISRMKRVFGDSLIFETVYSYVK